MRISERGQITIPKKLRDRYGLHRNVELQATPTEGGVLIHKRLTGKEAVDRVYGILGTGGSTDEYLAEIRGR